MNTDSPSRFPVLQAAIRVLRVLVIPCALAIAIVAGVGLYRLAIAEMPASMAGVAAVVVGVGLAGSIIALCETLLGIAVVLIKIESNVYRAHDVMLDVGEAARRQISALETITQHTRLSEVGRSIAYREQERELIRNAFNETLIAGDFEAAFFLAEQLETRHGYKQEADRLRREIENARRDVAERYVQESVDRVDQMLETREWERARVEIERLRRIYPNDAAIQGLPEVLRQRRADHKRRLLKEWDELVQRNEIDRGIALLRELDQFLTPNEAAALEESARGVFRAKLHNLGVQFSLAVNDHQWATALDIGQQIVTEFPNTRMAAEVREHLAALKTRAARSVEAPAGA